MHTIGRYEVVSEIGRGGMGVVYLARDPKLRRSVAIKVIHFDHVRDREQQKHLAARFNIEAQAAAGLSHPNIVTVHDFAEEDGRAYIVMELVEGVDLATRLGDERSIELPLRLRILRECAYALDHAHSRGVQHRDVKPANLLLKCDNSVKLSDFGIARINEFTGVTISGQILGTLGYMAPETISNCPTDHRSDQYSLAVVAYELFCQRRPFETSSLAALVSSIMSSAPPPISLDDREISERLDSALQKALAKNMADRYDSCSEFIEKLEDICSNRTRIITQAMDAKESQSWNRCLEERSLPALTDFIGSFPDSPLTSAAQRLLDELVSENRDWNAIQASRDPDAWRTFLDKYPQGQFIESAREKLYELDAEGAWKAILDKSDREHVEAYLALFPRGAYAIRAKEQLDNLKFEEVSWHHAQRCNSIAEWKVFLACFPDGMFSTKAKGLLNSLQRVQEERPFLEIQAERASVADGAMGTQDSPSLLSEVSPHELFADYESTTSGGRSKPLMRLWTLVGISTLAVSLIGFWFLASQSRQEGSDQRAVSESTKVEYQRSPEETEWLVAKSGSVRDLDSFIRKYPNGAHRTDASRMREEWEDWERLKRDRKEMLFQEFFTRHPSSRFTASARLLLEDIQGEEAQWKSVEISRDTVHLQRFLERYPRSKYAASVTNVLKELSEDHAAWAAVKDTGDVTQITQFIKRFPQSSLLPFAQNLIKILQEESTAWDKLKNSRDRRALSIFLQEVRPMPVKNEAEVRLRHLDAEEATAWNLIKGSADETSIRKFLTDFPNGLHTVEAQLMVSQMTAERMRRPNVEAVKVTTGTVGIPSSPEVASRPDAESHAKKQEGIFAPTLIYKVEPIYPQRLAKEKIQGVVVVAGVVDENGRLTDARIVQSLHPEFDQIAIDTVLKWKFRPGILRGKVVKVAVRLVVNFRLHSSRPSQ